MALTPDTGTPEPDSSGTGALNTMFKLRRHNHVFILPGANVIFDSLQINYLGLQDKRKWKLHEDDDKEIDEEFDDDDERKKNGKRKVRRPIIFGKESFLNFKILAPKASITIGQNTILRGQIVARKIKVGKGAVVSREETFEKENDFEEAILEEDGSRFFVNELIVNFKDEATFLDAQNIASQIDGRIIGFIKTTNVYQIEVLVNTSEDLEAKIQFIRQLNNPLIEDVFRNYIFNIS